MCGRRKKGPDGEKTSDVRDNCPHNSSDNGVGKKREFWVKERGVREEESDSSLLQTRVSTFFRKPFIFLLTSISFPLRFPIVETFEFGLDDIL